MAIGDANPAYPDPEAARAAGPPGRDRAADVPVLLNFRFAAAGRSSTPSSGSTTPCVVHGEQTFALHRPVRAGDG